MVSLVSGVELFLGGFMREVSCTNCVVLGENSEKPLNLHFFTFNDVLVWDVNVHVGEFKESSFSKISEQIPLINKHDYYAPANKSYI